MTSPTALYVVSVATLVIFRCGFCVPVVVTSAHASAAGPAPSSTQALLKNEPASRSAWPIVWLAVQLIVPPGAREATELLGVQVRFETCASVTVTFVRVTFPSFLATIV